MSIDDPTITDSDLRLGIARAGSRLHLPITRMVYRVIREEIKAARSRQVAGEPEPARDEPEVRRVAKAIVRDLAD